MQSIFGDLAGIPLNAFEVRALSPEEIEIQNLRGMQSAEPTREYIIAMANYYAPPADPRPLDARFADFKARLAVAVAKRP